MSVVFVVVPVVAGGWPVISAAIVAAGAAMGYRAVKRAEESGELGISEHPGGPRTRAVDLVMENSQVVADALMRGESFTMSRGDIAATFRVDGRGACSVHVSGQNMTDAELEAAGRDLMDRVRQQFAYAKVMAELEERGFEVVREQLEADQSIRIRVRR
jgi:hypothetical protein